MLKLLILDFDGTIIDSNYIKQNAINDFAKNEYNCSISKKINSHDIRKLTRYKQLSKVKGSELTIKEKYKIDNFVNKKVLNAKIDNNLFLLFKICKLKKIKIFVVSNTPHSSLLFLLNKLKICDLFDGILGNNVHSNKVKIFNYIIKKIGIKPREALSIGDDIFDYFASKECNIPFLGIQDQSLNFISSNNIVLNDLRGVVTYIQNNYK